MKCPEQMKVLPNLHLKLDLVFSFRIVVYFRVKLILMAIVQTVLLDLEIILLMLFLRGYHNLLLTMSSVPQSSVGAILVTLLIAFSQEQHISWPGFKFHFLAIFASTTQSDSKTMTIKI